MKRAFADDPTLSVDQCLDGRTEILQRVLAAADLTPDERRCILRLNAPARSSSRADTTT